MVLWRVLPQRGCTCLFFQRHGRSCSYACTFPRKVCFRLEGFCLSHSKLVFQRCLENASDKERHFLIRTLTWLVILIRTLTWLAVLIRTLTWLAVLIRTLIWLVVLIRTLTWLAILIRTLTWLAVLIRTLTWLAVLIQISCTTVYRKLSREKTLANFKVLWLRIRKVFSVKFGGVVSFGVAQVRNLQKFSPQKSHFSLICESFLPQKFPTIR